MGTIFDISLVLSTFMVIVAGSPSPIAIDLPKAKFYSKYFNCYCRAFEAWKGIWLLVINKLLQCRFKNHLHKSMPSVSAFLNFRSVSCFFPNTAWGAKSKGLSHIFTLTVARIILFHHTQKLELSWLIRPGFLITNKIFLIIGQLRLFNY
jgi:hypothetical protein